MGSRLHFLSLLTLFCTSSFNTAFHIILYNIWSLDIGDRDPFESVTLYNMISILYIETETKVTTLTDNDTRISVLLVGRARDNWLSERIDVGAGLLRRDGYH